MWPNPEETLDLVTSRKLVTLTEEIINEKLHFYLFSEIFCLTSEACLRPCLMIEIVSFYTSLKTSENLRFPDVFRRYKK